jgi:hypothetical protein
MEPLMYELAKQYKEVENDLLKKLEQFIEEINDVIEKGDDDVIHYEIFNTSMNRFGDYDLKITGVGDYGFKVYFSYSDRYEPCFDHDFEITFRKEWFPDMSYYEVYNDMIERSKPLFEQDKETDILRLKQLAEISGYSLVPMVEVEWFNKSKGCLE